MTERSLIIMEVIVDESQPGSRRQRRVANRRNQILDAAARLFAERGFHRTTTYNIATAADVSEGTLYNYFESKDALLLAIMARLSEVQQMQYRFDEGLPQDARDFLLTFLRSGKGFVLQNNAMLQSVLSEILVDPELGRRYYREFILPGIQQIESHVRQRIARGQVVELDTEAIARIITGLMLGLYVLQVLGDPLVTGQWERLSENIIFALFDGLAPHDERPHSQT
jgi:TetR/AcrR family fatty acid metabolism transcriptional regulator